MKIIKIKQNNNFMDKALWKPSNSDEEGFTHEDIDGYVYRAGYKVPDKFDMLILLYMLYLSQQEDYKDEIFFSRHEVIQECGFLNRGWYYHRLEDSLKRWLNVTIQFKGTFCDGKNYISIGFHIIDDYKIDEKTKQVKVCFNKNWLLKAKVDKFFSLIEFNYYKALKGAVSRKLYELLKPFKAERKFKLTTLGKKLWLSGRKVETSDGVKEVHFASDVLTMIKPAINEINKLSLKKNLLKKMDIDLKEVFKIKYEITGKENNRVIVLKKEPIRINNGQEKEQVSTESHSKKPKEPLPLQVFDNPRWKEAIAWMESLTAFHPDRIEDIKNLPADEVALIYPYIKQQYENGKFKEGRIFKAFQARWYLNEAKEAIKADKKKEAEKIKAKEVEKRISKKEVEAKSLYDRIKAVVEKHGGRNKALYQGHPIVALNQDFISIQDGKKRQSFNLDQLEESDFSAPNKK